MAPRHPTATEQKPSKRKLPTGIQKRKKTTAPSKFSPTQANRLCSASTRDLPPSIHHIQSQIEFSADSPVAEANPPGSVQPLSRAPAILCESSHLRGRKRKRGPENEESDNQRQGLLPPTHDPAVAVKRLNKKNLKELNKLNCQKEPEVFDDMVKRSRSRSSRADFSEDNNTITSASTHKSALSLSNYRLINLDRHRIVFEHGPLPEEVQTRLDSVLQSRISEDDRREITSIAKSLCDDFPDVLRAACREDDSVELIYRALESINKILLDQDFAIRRKADWDPALKPTVERRSYTSVLPADTPNDIDSALNESTKKRQPYMTPNGSASTMPPPRIQSKQDTGGLKTPCPDITTGLHDRVVAAKLASLGVAKPQSDDFLKDLQFEKAFISCPGQPALLLRFPSLIVEGKSYATGKTLYEAQNQAAVSGSMMLVIQHKLSELAGSEFPTLPLAFSICSEGPIMELWVHHIASDASACYYKIHFLKICHASAFDMVVEFFLTILRIMRWARSTFLDDIAEKLLRVWESYQNITD